MTTESHAARDRRDPWRNLRIILYFNLPLIALLLLFDVWRALIHENGGEDRLDFIGSLTAHYGDVLPLVSSFTHLAEGLSNGAYIALMRELLLFNFVLWVAYTFIAAIVFCFAVPRLGLRGAVNAKYRGKAWPTFLLIAMLAVFALLNVATVGTPSGRDALGRLIFHHWVSVLRYNFTSVLCSALAMILIIHIFDLWTAWRDGAPPKHEANPDRG